MGGKLSYLLLMLIFAGIPVLIEFVFGFHLLKKYIKSILISVLIFVIITPFIEKTALVSKAWEYNPQKNMGIMIISSPLETLFFSILTGLAVAFAVTAWTYYEDNNKPIFRTSFHDVLHGTYTIWRKKSFPTKYKVEKRKK